MAAIFVDLDGTLIQYERSFCDIFADACDRVGVTLDDDHQRYYTERFFERFVAFEDDPFLGAARDLCHEYGLDVAPVAFRDARLAAEYDATTVADGAHGALEELAETHQLGVLSNGVGDVQREKLRRHGLFDVFETVVVSHDIGVMKPDSRLFAAAEARLLAERYVYVGDSPEDDIGGAVDAGWDSTVHVVDTGDDGCTGCHADVHIEPDGFGRLVEVV